MANNSITLTASMRNNLLSLQNTQKLFDMTQERLSTGKKVNSALDNATSYFTSQSLSKRADALTGLMDSMGQAVQTLKAADESLQALQTFVDQAKSLVNSALDTANAKAYITGNVNLGLSTDLATIGGITATDTFVIRKGDGNSLVSTSTFTGDQAVPGGATDDAMRLRLQDKDGNFQEVTVKLVAATDTINSVMNQIRDGFGMDAQGNAKVTVGLVEGKLTIKANDPNMSLIALDGTGADATTLASDLGLDTGTTITTGPSTITAAAKFDTNVVATAAVSATAGTYTFSVGGTAYNVEVAAGDSLATLAKNINSRFGDFVTASVSDKTLNLLATDPNHEVVSAANATVFTALAAGTNVTRTVASTLDVMDSINAIDGLQASLTDSGKLQVTAADGSNIVITDTAGNAASALGIQGVATNGTEVRATYAAQFDTVLNQINEMVRNDDTSYKGVNLLNGNDLSVNFNEARTSKLDILGQVMDTKNLGVRTARNEWTENADIQRALEQVDGATAKIEAFSSELAQNLSIVQTRQDFTENMVNVLQTGSDQLVLADMNEEAANMLALQVRQQLATNALSMSSQSAQSVLSLFR